MNSRAVAVIISGFFTLFTAFAIRYAYGLLLPYMLSSLAISKTEAGIIYSSYFITCTILAPVFGLLADRSDARIILTIFVAILGLGAFLMSYSASVVQASLFFALTGIGHSACWAPVVTIVQRWVSEKRRGFILSIVDLGSTSGIAVWSIAIPLIIGVYSWRTVWISLGISTLLVAGMNFFLIKSHPPSESGSQIPRATPTTRTPIKESYKEILRDSKFHLIGLSYLLISFTILIPFTFLTTYAVQELMISYQSATGLVAVIAVSGVVGKLVLGHISDSVGRIRIMMLCGVLTATGGLGLAYSHGFFTLLLFTVIFGAGYGTIWPVYAASARDLFSKDISGTIVGLWSLYHGLGSVISPVISGWTIDATGSYFWAFILAMVSGIMSFLILLPLPNKASGRAKKQHS
ncbi:nitrate/nitrite transporter [Thermodesulfobacteriota bacterium]